MFHKLLVKKVHRKYKNSPSDKNSKPIVILNVYIACLRVFMNKACTNRKKHKSFSRCVFETWGSPIGEKSAVLLINRLRIERVELKLEPASCVNFSNCLRWNRSEDRKKKND